LMDREAVDRWLSRFDAPEDGRLTTRQVQFACVH
jgi:hypothetical protein